MAKQCSLCGKKIGECNGSAYYAFNALLCNQCSNGERPRVASKLRYGFFCETCFENLATLKEADDE